MRATTLYGHLMRGSVRVHRFQRLKKGDEIGIIGNTGDSSGPHCHLTRIPGYRNTHWSGSATQSLGGTRAEHYKFLDNAPIIKNKKGLRPYQVSCGWMGYQDHGAIDFHVAWPDRTSIDGESILIWNQDYEGEVVGIYDFGDGKWHKTGVTVIVFSGYEDEEARKQSAIGGSAGIRTYVVKANQTLTDVAKDTQTTVSTLVSLNGISNPDLIYAGQILKVSAPIAATYTVEPDDNLTLIAKKFGTTRDILIAVNKLVTPDMIYPGDILTIPGSGEIKPQKYLVKPGDLLGRIAESHDTTVEELSRLNGITNPNFIYPGQIIRLY